MTRLLPKDHRQEVCLSLAFVLRVIDWHEGEYKYADLSALALVAAFLDTHALMCLDRHENTPDCYKGSAVLTFSALSSSTRQSQLLSPSLLIEATFRNYKR